MAVSVAVAVSFSFKGLAPPCVLFELEHELAPSRFRLSVGPASMTVLEVFEEDWRIFYFQPIFFEVNRTFVLSAVVNGGAEIYVDSVSLSPAKDTLWPFFFKRNQEANSDTRLAPKYPLQKYDNIRETHLPVLERRFIQRVKKIERSLTEGGEDNILDACGHLRSFLLDDFLDQVNRIYRQRIVFRVPSDDTPPPIDGEFYCLQRIYPIREGVAYRLLDKGDFLKSSFVYLRGECLTARQLIKLAANCLGVHHFGAPKRSSKQEEAAYREYDFFKLNAGPALLVAMEDISWCFIDSIEPLVQSIIARYPNVSPTA